MAGSTSSSDHMGGEVALERARYEPEEAPLIESPREDPEGRGGTGGISGSNESGETTI